LSVSIGGKEDGTDGTFGTRVLARFAPSNGNYAAGGLNVLQAILGVIGFRGSCFAAGTPLLTPTGEKSVEEFRPGDWILSAPENDPKVPLEAKQVEEVFESRAVLLNLHVGGQVIQTTAEHPFWVQGKGWTSTKDLKPGDLLRSHDGKWMPVEEVFDTGVEAPVYNLRIADYHTYFVASRQWGFSVWAHNASGICHGNSLSSRRVTTLYKLVDATGRVLKWGISSNPAKRYTRASMSGKLLVPVFKGSRKKMAALERILARFVPGPLNNEPWAGILPPP
jgi:hypothetical protein